MSIKRGIFQFCLGTYHSLFIFIRIFKSPDVQEAFEELKPSKCSDLQLLSSSIQRNIKLFCLINAAILFSCIFNMNYIIMPFLDWITYKLLWAKFQPLTIHVTKSLFQVFILYYWTLSTCCFYCLLQLLKYFKNGGTKSNLIKVFFNTVRNFFTSTLEIVAVFIFEIVLLAECLIMLLIPLKWLSAMLFHMHFSFLLSFMIFDFKWSLLSWTIKDRIDFMESRCTYFLGFGLVLSMLFSMPSSLLYSMTLATCFIPLMIFNGIQTKCEHLEPVVLRFPIFDFQFGLLNLLLACLGTNKK